MPERNTDKATISSGARVTLHFSLSLPDGTEIDSNYGKSPATFKVGDGNLLPGFEAALLGAAAGGLVIGGAGARTGLR